MAKGDNSLDLGKARFLAAWLMNRGIETRVRHLRAKYPRSPATNLPDYATGDDLVPIRLKALLEECESDEAYQRAQEVAERHLKQDERRDDEVLEKAIPDLRRLDRYERRAWSQHKRAIREFMNIKLMRQLEKITCTELAKEVNQTVKNWPL